MMRNVLSGTENGEEQKKTLCKGVEQQKAKFVSPLILWININSSILHLVQSPVKKKLKGPVRVGLKCPSKHNPRQFQYRCHCTSQRFRFLNFKTISFGLFEEKGVLPRKMLSKGQNKVISKNNWNHNPFQPQDI